MTWLKVVLVALCALVMLVSANQQDTAAIKDENLLAKAVKPLEQVNRHLRVLMDAPVLQQKLSRSSERVSLIEQIKSRRRLSAIDEDDKQSCCRAAYNLCEVNPDLSAKQRQKRKPKFFLRAKKACKKLNIFHGANISEKAICKFYSGHPTNCAMIPQSSRDFKAYDKQLQKCCNRAPKMCDDLGNKSLFFTLKRECHWFAANTPEAICAMEGSFECGDEWLGNASKSAAANP